MGSQDNVSFLRDIEDHKKIKSHLDKVKNVVSGTFCIKKVILKTIIGANFIALETAATIRKEYPKINVHVIEENEDLALDEKLGREVADVILE